MKKSTITKSNIYFLIILILEITVPYMVLYISSLAGIKNYAALLAMSHFFSFIVPAIIYFIITKENLKDVLKLNRISIKQILCLIPIILGSFLIMSALSGLSSMFFTNNVQNAFQKLNATPFIVLFLVFAVMPAITEEITMRGIILNGYNNISAFKSSLIVGLFFGIFHLNMQQFFYTAVIGFIFAYVVRITNSLFSSMILHCGINGITVILQKLVYSNNTSLSNTTTVINGQIIVQLILMLTFGAIITILCLLMLKHLQDIKKAKNNSLKSY